MHRRKRIDPRVIGSFVIGAIILSVAGLLFFGPGGFLTKTSSYVIYFDSSVKGLTIGSPVRFRGVKIGQIKEINVRAHPNEIKFYVPIVIEIEPSKFNIKEADQSIIDMIKTTVGSDGPISILIEKGLRAQMRLDSLVTGQLYINLDMFPNTPILLSGEKSDYPEIPTIKSSLGELSQVFEEVPLREISHRLVRIIEGVEKLISSEKIYDSLENFNKTTTQLNLFLKSMDKQLPLVVEDLKETLKNTRLTLQTIHSAVTHVDDKIEPLSEQFNQTAQSINDTALKTQVTIEQINRLSADDSKIMKQLSLTLKEINQTARAVRYLTTEIEHDPQILLRGRKNGDTR
jgi:paraquat-inducible protein B